MALNPGAFKSERFQLLSFAIANPGAGNTFSQVVPDNLVHQCLSVRFQLVTSAVVADRAVSVRIDTGGLLGTPVYMPFTQPANITRNYIFTVGIASADLSAVPTALAVQTALPCGFYAEAGDLIGAEVDNMDVGDVITTIESRVKIWRIQ